MTFKRHETDHCYSYDNQEESQENRTPTALRFLHMFQNSGFALYAHHDYAMVVSIVVVTVVVVLVLLSEAPVLALVGVAHFPAASLVFAPYQSRAGTLRPVWAAFKPTHEVLR